jgi:hypothetical protein
MAIWIAHCCFARDIDGMGEQVTPHGLVDEFAVVVFYRGIAGHDRAVRPLSIVVHVRGGDQPPRVAEGSGRLVHIDNGAKLMQAEQFPRAAVVVAGPTAVEHVAEAEKPVRGRGRGQPLPRLLLIARSAEHHDPVHALMDGKPRRGGRAVRAARHDHAVPPQDLAVVGEECLPAPRRILMASHFTKTSAPLLHPVGLGYAHGVAEILAGGGFEADFAEVLVVPSRSLPRQLAEPAVGVMHLDRVQPVARHAFKELPVVPHDQITNLPCGTRVSDHRPLDIAGPAFPLKTEINLWMLLRPRIRLLARRQLGSCGWDRWTPGLARQHGAKRLTTARGQRRE